MNFNIEIYINDLPNETRKIDLSNRELKFIPSLKKFLELEELDCSNNQLTSLPELPVSLEG
jgi:hypothetical protein